jgi:hypothetical protein
LTFSWLCGNIKPSYGKQVSHIPLEDRDIRHTGVVENKQQLFGEYFNEKFQ